MKGSFEGFEIEFELKRGLRTVGVCGLGSLEELSFWMESGRFGLFSIWYSLLSGSRKSTLFSSLEFLDMLQLEAVADQRIFVSVEDFVFVEERGLF